MQRSALFGPCTLVCCLSPLSQVQFTPTVEHCSMATLIGLCIRVKLLRALPPRFKVHGCGKEGCRCRAWC